MPRKFSLLLYMMNKIAHSYKLLFQIESASHPPHTSKSETGEPSRVKDDSILVDESSTIAETGNIEVSSSSSVPDREISIWEDQVSIQNEKRDLLNSTIEELSAGKVSPIRSTLNTDWDDVATRQQGYYIKKTKQVLSVVLETLAPGQERELWKATQASADIFIDSEGEPPLPQKRKKWDDDTLKSLVYSYNQAESSQTQTQILSIFVNDYSKSDLQELIPGLSKYKIDLARKHASEVGGGKPPPEVTIRRSRLDPVKVDHFIDFISTSLYLQDVAFGTRNLKMDDGRKITIPNAIRTVIPSRIIRQYQNYCSSNNFEPASESTLYRVLRVCSASQQKSLQGLDYYLTEGGRAFDTLSDMLTSLRDNGCDGEFCREAGHDLKASKLYLKSDFKTHVSVADGCSHHCLQYALSDPKSDTFSSKCNHNHILHCERCSALDLVMNNIKEKIMSSTLSQDEKERMMYEFDIAKSDIEAWKAHIARTSNQECAKHDVLNNLNDSSVLLVMDWAMKFLPMRFREQMSDFYGKRGRSWHVSCVISKENGSYEVECYVHIFNSCTQNWYAVASVVEHVLSTVKKVNPKVERVFVKSDNAGCYHNSQLLFALQGIGNRTGITVKRYDFSDPQSGKDICDRKIAPMKAHIRRYVNEKHDVLTAEDMKRALESHGGTKGCRVAVAEVNLSNENKKASKGIDGISLLNNFAFEQDGIRAWKAYAIGPGKLFSSRQNNQGPTDLTILCPFQMTRRQKGTLRRSTSQSSHVQQVFSCREEGCILTFTSHQEMESHMDTQEHRREVSKETMYDTIRRKWAVKVSHLSRGQILPTVDSSQDETTVVKDTEKGWALKGLKKHQKVTQGVRCYLNEKFETGNKTGRKADPSQVSKEMRHLKRNDGELKFSPSEWKTTRQIASYFSRLAAKQKHNGGGSQLPAVEPRVSELLGDDEDDDFEYDADNERQNMHDHVFQELGVTHPIQFREMNLCLLYENHTMDKRLKLKDLKEICEHFKINKEGPSSKRLSFLKPLEEYMRQCTCISI